MLQERPSLVGRIFLRFARVTIFTDEGMRFRAKIGKALRNEVRRLNPLY